MKAQCRENRQEPAGQSETHDLLNAPLDDEDKLSAMVELSGIVIDEGEQKGLPAGIQKACRAGNPIAGLPY
jgi:hypothetical protein